MTVTEIIENKTELHGRSVCISGVLVQHAKRLCIVNHGAAVYAKDIIYIKNESLFDLVLDLIFPFTIGGGISMFYHEISSTGIIEYDCTHNSLMLDYLSDIKIKVDGFYKDLVIND